jgi:hypothetical protein
MSTDQLALMVMLVLNTGALFYWGGAVRQMLKDHERRITRLEDVT